jgi:hypothetical protein
LSVLSHFDAWLSKSLSHHSDAPSSTLGKPSATTIVSPVERDWILSLLSSLDELLTGSDISSLRSLAKTCLSVLRFLGFPLNEEDQEGACWMIVAAVADVWKQSDLWEA